MSIRSRARQDMITEGDPDSWLIARLTGLNGETISVEKQGDLYPEDAPLILVHGPNGGEKYRITASDEAIIEFALELLRWARKGGVTP